MDRLLLILMPIGKQLQISVGCVLPYIFAAKLIVVLYFAIAVCFKQLKELESKALVRRLASVKNEMLLAESREASQQQRFADLQHRLRSL